MTHTSHESHNRRQQPTAPTMAACQADDVSANANMDATPTHLHEAHEHTLAAIAHMEAIRADSRVDTACCDAALDALRDALTAIEAEAEAGYAD